MVKLFNLYTKSSTIRLFVNNQSRSNQMSVEGEGIKFSEMLRALRESKCTTNGKTFSQLKLAQIVGCDSSHISRIEKGVRSPSRDMVMRLASALDLDKLKKDQLLMSADFMPENISSILAEEPVVAQLWEFLHDDVLEQEKEAVRMFIHWMLAKRTREQER